MKKPQFLFLGLVLLAFSPSIAPAQTSSEAMLRPPIIELEIAGRKFWTMPKLDVWGKLGQDEKRFVQKYMDVMQSGNMGALKQLVLPESITCLNTAPEELRKRNLDSIISDTMQGDAFSLAFEAYQQKFEPDFSAQLEHWNTDPGAHTHTFLFGFITKQGKAAIRNHKLIKKGSEFFIVLGCPTPASVKLLEESKAQEEEYEKGLAKALAALTTDQRDTLYELVSKGADEPAAEEYAKMHPQYEKYSRGVVYFLKGEYFAKLKEKRRLEAAKTQESTPPEDVGEGKKDESVVSNQVAQPAQAITSEDAQSDPYKMVKMASLLALIFAVSVLLLRVLKRNDPNP